MSPLGTARFYHWAAVDSNVDRNYLLLTAPTDRNLFPPPL
jgi:hypothetical protein